jgi:hypothetical protein
MTLPVKYSTAQTCDDFLQIQCFSKHRRNSLRWYCQTFLTRLDNSRIPAQKLQPDQITIVKDNGNSKFESSVWSGDDGLGGSVGECVMCGYARFLQKR